MNESPSPETKDLLARATNAVIHLQTSIERLTDSVDDLRARGQLVHPSHHIRVSWRRVMLVSALIGAIVGSAVSVALALAG